MGLMDGWLSCLQTARSDSQELRGAVIRRLLLVMAPFILLELVLLVLAGLAYFLLVYWLFLLTFTSTPFIPQLARLLSGVTLYKKNQDKLSELSRSKTFRTRWLLTNMLFLLMALVAFKYNIRLSTFLFA